MANKRNLFKHLYAETPKPEFTYQDLKKPYTSGEGCYVTASPLLFAVSMDGGGGPVMIHRQDNKGRLPTDHRVLNVHSNKVLDFQFSPFIDTILACASADATVTLTDCPEDPSDMKENISKPDILLTGHAKKVHLLKFHPTALNVLATSSWDKTVKLWNVATSECVQTYDDAQEQNTMSMDFNADGGLLAVTTKAKLVKIFDPRQPKDAVTQFECSDGTKSSKIFWAESAGYIGATCYNRMAKRKLRLWDLRALDSKPVVDDVLDQMTSINMPFYDSENRILFTAGKGDGSIGYYQLNSGKHPYKFISSYRNSEPQRGGCFVPKRGLDTKKCEIARYLKLTKNAVIPLSFCVPRKTGADIFQSDLYPDCFAGVPSLTPEEYFDGQNAAKVTMSMDPEKRTDVEKIVFEKKQTYAELVAENAMLLARIAELEAKVKENEAE